MFFKRSVFCRVGSGGGSLPSAHTRLYLRNVRQNSFLVNPGKPRARNIVSAPLSLPEIAGLDLNAGGNILNRGQSTV